MPRPQKHHAQDTRERAIAAADALLHRHGYMGVSMDAVAEAIGVRKASLYHHFPEGKEQLVMEFAERALNQDAAGFERAIEAHRTARRRLEAIARYVSQERLEISRVLRDALRFMREEHQNHVFDRFYQTQYLRVKEVIDEGIERGEFRPHDSEFSAWAFLGLMSEMKSLSQYSPEDVGAKTVELLLHGIST